MPGQAAGDNPGFIAPMLATAPAGLPPDADEFVAEVKWDGLRPWGGLDAQRMDVALTLRAGALADVAGKGPEEEEIIKL